MNSTQSRLQACFHIACVALLALPSVTFAQVRTKKPDRGVYQPPRVGRVSSEPRQRRAAEPVNRSSDAKARAWDSTSAQPRRELVDVELDDLRNPTEKQLAEVVRPTSKQNSARLQRVDHEEVVLIEPDPPAPIRNGSAGFGIPPWSYQRVSHRVGTLVHGWTCDGCPRCDSPCDAIGCDSIGCTSPGCTTRGCAGCDSIGCNSPGCTTPGCAGCDSIGCNSPGCAGCDSIGCDSIGCVAPGCESLGCDSIGCNCASCQTRPWYGKWSGPALGLRPGEWFGSAELLLLFRRGDRLPPLVTTGPAIDPDTAGELGQPDTSVLVGTDSILKDMTAGARFTFGLWLDRSHCHSLVFRSWMAGDEEYGFSTNQTVNPVIARPFLNVTDGAPVEQDTFLVAFPARATGSINVQAVSELYGGDISIRQFWYAQCNHTVDVLYGYQYMRLNESLLVSSTSTSLDAAFAPIGSVISIADAFNAENEFHGAQFGLASRYREGCWSFDAIAKLGFGSLRRRAIRSGATATTVGGSTAVDPNGLLVRSTNAGTVSDNTFGWVPEIDLSIGWRKYPNWDVTFGYFIIGMTDALQASGTIDPSLAVNLANPPTGQQRPTAALSYNSYYAQGLQFGIKHTF
jgi:hypothetical protein